MNFVEALTWTNLLFLLKGLLITLEVAFFSILISFIFGVILGTIRYAKAPVANQLAYFYIETIRNSPLLLIIYFTFFALPQVGIKMEIMAASVFALSIFTSALIAEIVRGGLQSIEKGQIEAARSQGFTYLQTLRYIVLPQGLKRMIPPLVSQFITLLKDTSFCMIIGLQELTTSGKIVFGQNVNYVMPVLTVVAILYFVINYALSLASKRLEKKLSTT